VLCVAHQRPSERRAFHTSLAAVRLRSASQTLRFDSSCSNRSNAQVHHVCLKGCRTLLRPCGMLPHPVGCPANVVTGGGAGSSLLRDPQQLSQVVSALVAAVGDVVPVSVKMRSGFADTSLFTDNLLAVQEAGASFVTLHPRTKAQAYAGRADWSLIATAKQLLSIPVVSQASRIRQLPAAAEQLLSEPPHSLGPTPRLANPSWCVRQT
jgi:hypothetical protein